MILDARDQVQSAIFTTKSRRKASRCVRTGERTSQVAYERAAYAILASLLRTGEKVGLKVEMAQLSDFFFLLISRSGKIK